MNWGIAIATGAVCPRDHVEARRWYRLAARQGERIGRVRLACLGPRAADPADLLAPTRTFDEARPTLPLTEGMTRPTVAREVKPRYSEAAMRAQVTGAVEMEILILEAWWAAPA